MTNEQAAIKEFMLWLKTKKYLMPTKEFESEDITHSKKMETLTVDEVHRAIHYILKKHKVKIDEK